MRWFADGASNGRKNRAMVDVDYFHPWLTTHAWEKLGCVMGQGWRHAGPFATMEAAVAAAEALVPNELWKLNALGEWLYDLQYSLWWPGTGIDMHCKWQRRGTV